MCPSENEIDSLTGFTGAAIDRATETALGHFDRDALIHSLEAAVKAKLRHELEALIRERLDGILERELPEIVAEAYRVVRKKT